MLLRFPAVAVAFGINAAPFAGLAPLRAVSSGPSTGRARLRLPAWWRGRPVAADGGRGGGREPPLSVRQIGWIAESIHGIQPIQPRLLPTSPPYSDGFLERPAAHQLLGGCLLRAIRRV